MIRKLIISLILNSSLVLSAYAATNLKLNPNLNYSSDSDDGPLIMGDELTDGTVHRGKPAYIIFFQRECYNSKHQAKRTVELYEKYKGQADFIVIDLDAEISKQQAELRDRFYTNYIPHVTIVDRDGQVVYNKSGEIDTARVSDMLDSALKPN
jgi:thioredoxin-related protein